MSRGISLYTMHFPGGKAECICRSGVRFKRCCKDGIEQRLAGRHTKGATSDEHTSLQQRLRDARLEFSFYWIRHVAHRSIHSESSYASLLDVDLRAMSDLLERIMFLAVEAGQRSDFLQSLERLRGVVADSRWPVRISFLRALTRLFPDWDEAAKAEAKRELETIDTSGLDINFLQVHYSLFAESLGLSDRLKWLERLETASAEPGQKLQYGAGYATTLALHNDSSGARRRLSESLLRYESSGGSTNEYGLLQYGLALTDAIRLGMDQPAQLLDKADNAFLEMMRLGRLNQAGLAHAELWRGRAHAAAGQWDAAVGIFQRSQAYQFSPLAAIFLAESFANLGRRSEAKAVLTSLDYSSLNPTLRYDYCLSFALSLSESDSPKELSDFLSKLNDIQVLHPLLAEQLRDIVGDIKDIQQKSLATEIESLRVQLGHSRRIESNEDLRSAISAHRSLPPQRQTLALPNSNELPHFLLEILVQTCAQLLDQRQLLSTAQQSREDTYTAFITSLLQQRVVEFGWSVSDQRLGGLPSKVSPERGKRDLAFWKGGDSPFGIVEALRLSSFGATGEGSLNEHLSRLVSRYDACGSAVPFLVVFAEVVDFEAFTNKYMEHLSGVDLADAPVKLGPHSRQDWKRDGLFRRAIKLLETSHDVRGVDVSIFHLVAHLPDI